MVALKIYELVGRFIVRVTTRSGRIYMADWGHEPTQEEAKEAWHHDRRHFHHVN